MAQYESAEALSESLTLVKEGLLLTQKGQATVVIS